MSEKKHIDRLFQEKLKDLEVFPDPSAWKAIEERLAKKKKRRIVPLLLRWGSAAAILLLLISTGFWYFSQEETLQTPTNTIPVVTDTDQQKASDTLDATEEKKYNTTTQETEVASTKSNSSDTPQLNSNTATQQTGQSLTQNRNRVAPTVNQNQQATKNIEKEALAIEQADNKVTNSKNIIAENKELPVEQDSPQKKDFQITKEDIAEAIENDLRDKEEINNEQRKKWSVGTTVAPVYFNSLSDGSPINSSLAANDKVTEGTISYGIKVNYKLNKKLSIQTGINSVDLAYKTRGVTALVSSNELLLSSANIDTNIDGINLITISSNQIAAQSSELNSQRGILNLRGDLNQSFSYIEVPLEAKYALVDKKIGVHVVGGMSTYVLYNNKVSLLDQNGSTTLGEASNVNDINFSGNFGIDLDYKLNKKLFINVSPMFKYQINTFSKNDGGFKPYYLGVYTGLNFRF